MTKNYGFNIQKEIDEQSDSDWLFGAAFVPDKARIPETERKNFLPRGELQKGAEDMMDCATRGPNNKAEAKLNYLLRKNLLTPAGKHFLFDNGYITSENQVELSDAFTAIKSGTTKQGNSMKAPLEAMREFGCIPKRMLPLEAWMTWNDYHNPARITNAMIELGLKFKKHFKINYQKVYEHEYKDLIKEDILIVAGFAWPPHQEGVYPRVEGMPPNHVWINFEDHYLAFDNYPDSFDGDFIKKLASNYDFVDYGYRLTLNEEEVIPKEYPWWKKWWLSIKRHLGL